MRYEVQTRTMMDGWVNAWSDDDGRPLTFATEMEAEAEILDLLAGVRQAVAAGDMAEEYDRADYRVVLVMED